MSTSACMSGPSSFRNVGNLRLVCLQWDPLHFHDRQEIFEGAYLRDAMGYEAYIPPIDSAHGHIGSWKYELATTSVSGRTKNRDDSWSFPLGSHYDLPKDFPCFGSSMALKSRCWYSSQGCGVPLILCKFDSKLVEVVPVKFWRC